MIPTTRIEPVKRTPMTRASVEVLRYLAHCPDGKLRAEAREELIRRQNQ